MIQAKCATCGKRVWRGMNENAPDYFEEASDIVRFPGAHNGGLAVAVRIRGVYRLHRCAARMHIEHERVKVSRRARGVRTARERRAQERRKVSTSLRFAQPMVSGKV